MTTKTRMLQFKTRDEALVSVIRFLLKTPCVSDWETDRRYDQIVALDVARQALKKRPRKKGSKP